jgi:hypothetical protein
MLRMIPRQRSPLLTWPGLAAIVPTPARRPDPSRTRIVPLQPRPDPSQTTVKRL